MLLRYAHSISLQTLERAEINGNSRSASIHSFNTANSDSWRMFRKINVDGGLVIKASKEANNRPHAMDITFEPFEEVKKELLIVPTIPQASLSRHMYSDDSEAAINEQINVEYNVSYIYHALYAYFDRDNVALKGLAKFFKDSSAEERGHAEKFMGCGDNGSTTVRLVVDRNNDVQLTDFVESEFLIEQVESIKKISEYVAQLRRVGKGHGVWNFDQTLLGNAVVA